MIAWEYNNFNESNSNIYYRIYNDNFIINGGTAIQPTERNLLINRTFNGLIATVPWYS